MSSCRLYIGNISHRTTKKDIIQNFEAYGHIVRVDLKDKFAFLEYDKEDACNDAIRKMHRVDLQGRSIVVEMSHGKGPRGPLNRDSFSQNNSYRDNFEKSRYGRSERDRNSYRDRGDRGNNYSRGSYRPNNVPGNHYQSNYRNYQIRVDNISKRINWQDLKDFAREQVGSSVVRCDVYSDDDRPYGVIEFSARGDYDYALDHLDGKRLDSREIKVTPFKGRSGGGRNYDSYRNRGRNASPPRKSWRNSRRSRSRSRSSSQSRNRRSRSRSFPKEALEKSSCSRSVSPSNHHGSSKSKPKCSKSRSLSPRRKIDKTEDDNKNITAVKENGDHKTGQGSVNKSQTEKNDAPKIDQSNEEQNGLSCKIQNKEKIDPQAEISDGMKSDK